VFGNDAWIAYQRFAVLEGRSFSYEYGSGIAIGNGFTAKKAKYQQTNFFDHGRKNRAVFAKRW
jgi:hypothetical protein